jgi:hypothetical protein
LRRGSTMFREHQSTDIINFEKGVQTAFWNHGNGQPRLLRPSGCMLNDLLDVYFRLKSHFRGNSEVTLGISITEEEAWLGVVCTRYGTGLFYRMDADGSCHVWSSLNGSMQNEAGYEAQLKRICSVFGEPHKITELANITGQHIVHRLLGGPCITEYVAS